MIVILHPFWVHYKDLLFRAILETGTPFTVLFTSRRHADTRLAVPPMPDPYPSLVLTPRPYKSGLTPRAAIQAVRAILRIRPSLVVISGWDQTVSWVALAYCRATRTPAILWAESNEFDRPRVQWREQMKRIFLRGITTAHVYGLTNRDYLLRLGMQHRQVVLKRAVVDVDLFRPLGRRPISSVRTFLYVGRISTEKNLDMLLTAAKALLRSGREAFRVKIIGYGPLRSHLQSRVIAEGIQHIVMIGEAVQQVDLPLMYSGADLFVLPSTSEPWGLVVNEAMACGLPVIVSDQCGCCSDLVKPETGWSFAPHSLSSLLAAMNSALDASDDQLRQMGFAARSAVLEYAPAAVANRVLTSVNNILANQI